MLGADIRKAVLTMAFNANENHIASCLSVADILAVLYTDVIRGIFPDDPLRDRFVLSKGHAAMALYAALAFRGWLPMDILKRYCIEVEEPELPEDEQPFVLGAHPDHRTPGVEFSTGSLGMGITYAVGQAMALKRQENPARVFCLLSDAECQEGSVWEAVALASRLRLDNLHLIVDDNGMQALGPTPTSDITASLRKRFTAFGCQAYTAHGHTLDELRFHLTNWSEPARHFGSPSVTVATTVPGKGVSWMESAPLRWHYVAMSREQYDAAMEEVSRGK